jgi:uncharacterized damage-inducible protein DinB
VEKRALAGQSRSRVRGVLADIVFQGFFCAVFFGNGLFHLSIQGERTRRTPLGECEILDILWRRAIVGVPGSRFMAELNETVGQALAAYYEYVAAQVHQGVDPLSNERFWRRPYPYGNSIGHLVLHLTGNLNYYIGARVAETGYVRDREREFTDKQPPSKEEALRAFDRTIAMVVATIRKQTAEDWGKAYTAEREPEARDRMQIFIRCAGHAYHHVGQMVYLTRELART